MTLPKFTAEMARTMTPEQIRTYWVARQVEARAAGKPHYTQLIRPDTDEVVATIPELWTPESARQRVGGTMGT